MPTKKNKKESDKMDFISDILALLYEEGIEIEYNGVDLDLRDYINDSIQFISFIVDLENRFAIEMPDEYLTYDAISSLHSFAEIVKNFKDENLIEAHND